MSQASWYILLADTLLVVHFLFVLFVVFGLVAIYCGYGLHWRWVKNRTFRILHLIAIGIVALQSWLGLICPLTIWEMALRDQAGAATYSGSFIQHWLHQLLYYTAPDWLFMLLYSVFACLVLVSWFLLPPQPRKCQHLN
ncbi:hypothetical protein AR688_00925 [Rheinheimera sp. EpRS3]|nr:hypothetical protein AR688_00925 [Rheinheimera sp. EpRS3]